MSAKPTETKAEVIAVAEASPTLSGVPSDQPTLTDSRLRARSAHSKAQSRNYALPLPTAPAPVARDQEISNSILDTIWSALRYRKKPVPPDRFELFLRELREITLADIYHALSEKSAHSFDGLFWFRVSYQEHEHSSPQFVSILSDRDSADVSVADFFDDARRGIQGLKAGTLRLCCLTKTSPEIRELFSYFRLFSLSAYSEPQFWARTLLAHLLLWSQYITPEFVNTLLDGSAVEADTTRSKAFRLPSQEPLAFPRSNFDYIWPLDVIDFNIVEIHTKRPYKSSPKLERIQLYDRVGSDGSHNLTLSFDSSRVLESFKQSLNSSSLSIEKSADPRTSMALLSLYQVLFAIHRQMNEDAMRFVEKVTGRASEMVVHSRDHPGRAEFLYLVLLQDYVVMATYHMEAAQVRFCELLPDTLPATYLARKVATLEDTRYLIDCMEKLKEHLLDCQQQAKSLEELKQSQIAGIMSFLVAIYVPVAFVSSYFGMNTVEILNGDLHNATFWQIAIPLMVLTIMLPLSLTIIARVTRGMTLSAGAFSLRQWPMVVDLCIVAFCLAVIVAHIVHWRLSGTARFEAFFDRISPRETLIVDLVLACLALGKTVEQSVLRNRRGRKWFYYWTLIVFVILLCAGLSVVDDTFATLVTPFCFMFAALAVRPLIF